MRYTEILLFMSLSFVRARVSPPRTQIRTLILFLAVSLGHFEVAGAAKAAPLPERAEISKQLESVNAYFMKLWPDSAKGIGPRPSNIWTRGVYYEGLMALYQIDPKREYLDYAVRWGESHQWGLRHGNSTRNADDQCCGQTYLDLYLSDKKPELEGSGS